MDYNQIIKFFLSTSIVTSGLVYLAKLVLDKFSEARLEKYKNSLQNETEEFKHKLNFETEKFKQELNKTNIEHQIKYSKLYEERGQIIRLTYTLLFDLEKSLLNLTSVFQGPGWTNDKERENKATDAIDLLEDHLEQNRIFFSANLCDSIETIINESCRVIADMALAKRDQEFNDESKKLGINLTKEELLQPKQAWRQLDRKVQNDIRNERLKLAQEFRNLIGVE